MLQTVYQTTHCSFCSVIQRCIAHNCTINPIVRHFMHHKRMEGCDLPLSNQCTKTQCAVWYTVLQYPMARTCAGMNVIFYKKCAAVWHFGSAIAVMWPLPAFELWKIDHNQRLVVLLPYRSLSSDQ